MWIWYCIKYLITFWCYLFSFEVLERSFPADLTEGLIDLQRVAERLEWRIYSVARDQVYN